MDTLELNQLGNQTVASKPPAQATSRSQSEGLAKLREPFPDNLVSRLPKGGTYLSYVGHAALTQRLLEADPLWNWEPLALTTEGLPRFDESGGLWIRLTACGVTRLGYGHAKGKTGPGQEPGAREKEVIGDALRNAAMRFGAALDLWHKGDLHAHEEEAKGAETYDVLLAEAQALSRRQFETGAAEPKKAGQEQTPEELAVWLLAGFENCMTLEQVEKTKDLMKKEWPRIKGVKNIKESVIACAANAASRISAHVREPGEEG